jgi:hypothetical protein
VVKHSMVWLSLAAILAACSLGGSTEDLSIEKTDLLLLESYPVQVRLLVEGTLPACRQFVWDVAVDDSQGRIDVALRTVSDPQTECVTDRARFKETIPLGAFETAHYEVYLNGEAVETLELP